jgi:two-component system sensor histidine kinase CpxA
VRSFFVQIFLSFWISGVITFFLAAIIFPNPAHPSPDTMQAALRLSLAQLAQAGIHRGPEGCKDRQTATFFVLDEQEHDNCGQVPPPPMLELVARVRKANEQQYLVAGSEAFLAQPVTIDGKTYIAALRTVRPKQHWFPHMPPWALPVSVVVTFVVAYLLTKPVRALRLAFRRFAGGDMNVRLPVSRSALRDWGGADVRTLMIDFNEMADRIQALLQAHKTLLRDVSHELRSPLARLNVALELAREEAPEAASALDRAELESSRLNALIGELLSLSSMEALQTVQNRSMTSLSDLVDAIMPDLNFEAEARECEIVHRGGDTCSVLGSEDLLRRALENVIRNAVRYSPAGATVVVETLQNGGKSIVRVCDSGPGVPEESLSAIFRPFYRVDSSRQSKTGGFGVGLAIADRAIELHGGSVRAFNRQGGGLCVELSVPCAEKA